MTRGGQNTENENEILERAKHEQRKVKLEKLIEI